jgi:L-fucose mutarotase
MLKGIDPLIPPDLLGILASMGHGDEIAIVDANFPAESYARELVHIAGADSARVLRAVLSLMPVDDFVEEPACVMRPVSVDDAKPATHAEYQRVLNADAGTDIHVGQLDRFDFYDRVTDCFAVIATGERRLYGNIIVKKGVIRPGGPEAAP